jgi:excinuclease UvrABC nuclease subunit
MIEFSFLRNWFTPNTYDSDFAPLPARPGVYLLVRTAWYPKWSQRVLYVGMSRNLRQRLLAHPVWAECEQQNGKFDCVRVYFRTCPSSSLRRVEKALIRLFHPGYNLQHRLKGE